MRVGTIRLDIAVAAASVSPLTRAAADGAPPHCYWSAGHVFRLDEQWDEHAGAKLALLRRAASMPSICHGRSRTAAALARMAGAPVCAPKKPDSD